MNFNLLLVYNLNDFEHIVSNLLTVNKWQAKFNFIWYALSFSLRVVQLTVFSFKIYNQSSRLIPLSLVSHIVISSSKYFKLTKILIFQYWFLNKFTCKHIPNCYSVIFI